MSAPSPMLARSLSALTLVLAIGTLVDSLLSLTGASPPRWAALFLSAMMLALGAKFLLLPPPAVYSTSAARTFGIVLIAVAIVSIVIHFLGPKG